MLHEKYMPSFQFSAKHCIRVAAIPEKIYPLIHKFDFSHSRVTKLLMTMRGLGNVPAQGLTGLLKMGFVILETKENEEIILGLAGQFWRPTGNIRRYTKEEFIAIQDDQLAKATWNFQLIPKGKETLVETETRIWCGKDAYPKFKRYWFIVKPFSGLIRTEMLKGIKKKVDIDAT